MSEHDVFIAPQDEQDQAIQKVFQLIKTHEEIRQAGWSSMLMLGITTELIKRCLWAKHNDPKKVVKLLENHVKWYRPGVYG